MLKVTKSLLKFSKSNYLCSGMVKRKSRLNLKISEIGLTKFKPTNETYKTYIKTPRTDDKITRAKTVNDLLMICEGVGVSQRLALKVVPILADWTKKGEVELKDFEADQRFIKLCHVLMKNKNNGVNNTDLAMIVDVAADDESAKLIENLSVAQMIKVVQNLSFKKRRSIPILRSISYNLTRLDGKLNLKQCADLLYSISVLNFYDVNLLHHICNNVIEGLNCTDLNKSFIVGSIVSSFGYLKYKNMRVMDEVVEWFFKNLDICRLQDIFTLIITMGIINFKPKNNEFFQQIMPYLNIKNTPKPTLWLDLMFSLVILNEVKPLHVSTVLSNDFIKQIDEENFLTQLKLLYLHGYSSLSYVTNLQIKRSKNKEVMVNSVIETLKNLMSSECMNTSVDTRMGFFIDAICYLDSNCTPVQIKHVDNTNNNLRKIAIMVYDYNDMTRGQIEVTGMNVLASRLLERQGFRIVDVSYIEFKISDKLVDRVKFLEAKLKSTVN